MCSPYGGCQGYKSRLHLQTSLFQLHFASLVEKWQKMGLFFTVFICCICCIFFSILYLLCCKVTNISHCANQCNVVNVMSLSNAHCASFLLTFKYVFIGNLVLLLKFSSSKLPWICHSNDLERDKLIFSHVAKIASNAPTAFKLWSSQPSVRPKRSSKQTLCVHWALR